MFLDPIADKIMVAAVILMLVGDAARIARHGHLIAAMVILLREIMVSGLREFLGGIQVSVPVSQLAKWKTTLQLVALGALILAGALPGWPWVQASGCVSLWGAAVLTLHDRLGLSARRPEAHGQLMAIDMLYFAWVREGVGTGQERVDPPARGRRRSPT